MIDFFGLCQRASFRFFYFQASLQKRDCKNVLDGVDRTAAGRGLDSKTWGRFFFCFTPFSLSTPFPPFFPRLHPGGLGRQTHPALARVFVFVRGSRADRARAGGALNAGPSQRWRAAAPRRQRHRCEDCGAGALGGGFGGLRACGRCGGLLAAEAAGRFFFFRVANARAFSRALPLRSGIRRLLPAPLPPPRVTPGIHSVSGACRAGQEGRVAAATGARAAATKR